MRCRRHKHRLTYSTIRALVNSLQPLKPESLAPSEVFLFSGYSCLVALHAYIHVGYVRGYSMPPD